MADDTLGSLLVEIGIEASGFKNQMKEISQRMGIAKSEFLAAGGIVKSYEDTVDGLKSKIAMLTEQIQFQKARQALLTEEHRQAAAGGKDTAAVARDLEMQLNGTTAEIVKMQKELSDSTTKLNSFGKEEKDAEKKSKDLHGSLGNLGAGLKNLASGVLKAAAAAVAAVATATGAAIAGAVELGKQAMETADTMQQMADITGFTAEQLQIMDYQGKALGVDLDTMQGAQSRLTKSMDAAKSKTSEQAKVFKELGVSTRDSDGNLRDSKVVMQEVINALGKVANETERDTLALQLFSRGAMELNPLIKAGGEELARLADEAERTGAVMSNETVAALDAAGDAMDGLKSSAIGIAGTLLSTFQPQIDSTITMFKGLAASASEASKSGDWTGFTSQAIAGLQGLMSQITAMLPTFISVGTKMLTTMITALVEAVPIVLPQLIDAALQLVDAMVGILSAQGPTLITTAIEAIGSLVMGLLEALPQLLDAAIQIVLALVDGISKQLPTLIPAAVDCVMTLVQTLVDNLPMLIDAAIKLVLALVDGIIAAIPKILEAAPRIVISLVNGIVQAIPKLLDAAMQIITALIKFMPIYFPMLVNATPQIIGAIVSGLIANLGNIISFIPKMLSMLWEAFKSIKWAEFGKNMIDGIVSGITSAASAIWNAVKKAVQGALNSVKDFLGIRSPSKVMKDQIGMMLGAGLAEGITGSGGLVNKAMAGLQSQLRLRAMNMSPAFAGDGASGSTNVANHYSVTVNAPGPYNVRSDADIERITQGIARKTAAHLRALGG